MVWATRSRTDFRSLRWRIAGSYAVLLLAAIALVAIVLTFQLRSILYDEARAKTDSVGSDISQLAHHTSQLVVLGEPSSSFEQDLIQPGNLEHWASPSTYVEIDRHDGYPIAKTGNMGGAVLAPSPKTRATVVYQTEQNATLGPLLVRDEVVKFPDDQTFIVKVAESLAIYDTSLARVRELLIGTVASATIVLLAGSALISRALVLPINRLIVTMRGIGSEQLDRRIGWTTRHDEIGELAASFDAMLGRLEESFARERQFISDASHELKTPLTIINANAQMLERWGDRDPVVLRDSLRAIRDESGALAGMVSGMLVLAKAESGDAITTTDVALGEVAGEAVQLVRTRAEEKGLALGLDAPADGGPHLRGDTNLLRQLVTNLIDNAVKFTERGRIDVTVTPTATGGAEIAVADTGVGIEPEVLERVFDRFFRTDRSRAQAIEGTGLGLAIVRSIARVHGGSVAAERNAAGGTTFRVRLPGAALMRSS